MMRKILILTEHYPSTDNIYNYMFIHSRVLEYLSRGYAVKVLYLSLSKELYNYEGVEVYKGSYEEYKRDIGKFNPDVIFTHSPKKLIVESIDEIKKDLGVKNFTWIHGVEALSAFRRVFNISTINEAAQLFTIGVISEIRRVFRFRKYIKCVEQHNDEFIFVSKWMKNITESDNFTTISKYKIIPNFIDSEGFKVERNYSTKNILIVRSFESKKYANDISIDILNELNKLRQDFNITIFGKGRFYKACLDKLTVNASRVTTVERMLPREELKECFKNTAYSYFLCPTRQDAQGVTMCEAMASGLVIVTNNSTAIPEFVNEKYAIISDSASESARKISEMMSQQSECLTKSRAAVEYVKNNLSANILIAKELELI